MVDRLQSRLFWLPAPVCTHTETQNLNEKHWWVSLYCGSFCNYWSCLHPPHRPGSSRALGGAHPRRRRPQRRRGWTQVGGNRLTASCNRHSAWQSDQKLLRRPGVLECCMLGSGVGPGALVMGQEPGAREGCCGGDPAGAQLATALTSP